MTFRPSILAFVFSASAALLLCEAGSEGALFDRESDGSPAWVSSVKRADERREKGKFAAAAKIYKKAVEHVKDEERQAEILVKLADCYLQTNERYDAYKVCKRLLNTRALYVRYDKIIDRVRDLAERFADGRGAFLGFKSPSRAVELYTFILEKAPSGKRAAADTVRLAELQIQDRELEDAVYTYRELVRSFETAPEAATGRLELGKLLIRLSRTGDGDGRLTREAEAELKTFVRDHPIHERRKEAETLLEGLSERQAASLLALGVFYLRPVHKRTPASRRYLHDVARDYAGTQAASVATGLLASLEEGGDVDLGAVKIPQVPTVLELTQPGGRGDSVVSAGAEEPGRHVDDEATPRPPVDDDVSKWLLPIGEYEADDGDDQNEK